jgi:hypothetical protein
MGEKIWIGLTLNKSYLDEFTFIALVLVTSCLFQSIETLKNLKTFSIR